MAPIERQNTTSVIKNLKNKINQAKKLGFRHFAIFFDDLDQKKDQNLASSHAEILELVSKLLKNLKGSSLMFCPTIYCNSFAKGDISNNDYLLGLASKINKNISYFGLAEKSLVQILKIQTYLH